MRAVPCLFATVVFSHLLTIGVPSRAAEVLSAGDLISLAPRISSSDEKCKSIEIGGYLKEKDDFYMRFQAFYQSPDQFAFFLQDAADGTPILYSCNHKVLLYDPVSYSVLLSNDTNIEFSIMQIMDKFELSGDLIHTSKPCKLSFDIKSLLGGSVRSSKVDLVGNGKYRLTQITERGNSLVASVDMSVACPFQKLEIIDNKQHFTPICIDKILLNTPVVRDPFRFPSKETLAERITVREWPSNGLVEKLTGWALMMRACSIRVGARDSELRQTLRFPGFSTVDWEKVKENDKKFSRALRELLAPIPLK
ncbi:hypothetical protein SAMN05444166_5863 [Singulisphaera sp. GP187]|nr:hypothetical protein SAMN05444166_5863 [Singulisphaera sp. GP187]